MWRFENIMNPIRATLAQLLPPRDNPNGLMVVRPAAPAQPVLWDPRPHGQPPHASTIYRHLVDSVKKRMRMKIDATTARVAIPALRSMTEQAKLATEYQTSINALSLSELEREVRLAELEQRKLELSIQRRQHQHLEGLRLQKEQLALQAEISTLQRQIADQQRPPEPRLTPAQQKFLKKTEVEEQLQQLRVDEARALQRATGDLEKRRLQNIYANRRERLMEQLEKYL
jgi:hypothetical protein